MTFHLFALDDGHACSAQVPTLSGEMALRLAINRKGQHLHLQAEGVVHNWRVLLRGIETVASLENGRAERQELGTAIIPAVGVVIGCFR